LAIGSIIIGDEILSGRRQDKHFARLIALLGARGLALDWALHLGDDRVRLAATFARTLETDDIVFSFGGIGATPDDHTRQAVAAALRVPLVLHPEAEREIRARFGEAITAQRLTLGEFPAGASIIPNPFNRIPGFSVREHHFVPGFPEMAWPMVESLLDGRYAHLHHATPQASAALVIYEGSEGALIDLMLEIERDFPRVKVFSLPSFGGQGVRRHLELGVRGAPAQVESAIARIRGEVGARGLEWIDKPES
jgi:molybdopterin-biosynthesis enzyme MoeA-like protein